MNCNISFKKSSSIFYNNSTQQFYLKLKLYFAIILTVSNFLKYLLNILN